MKISAYIPCRNGAATLARVIAGLRGQELAPDELFVVDDGSTDGSAEIAETEGVRVIKLGASRGRGAARARAMEAAAHPLVASCDASIEVPPDFLSRAAKWFENPEVAAVCARIAQRTAVTTADRWRARHLFRTDRRTQVEERAAFFTGAAVLRAEAARAAGGYDAALVHGEDADLGRRLLEKGKVVFDPAIACWQLGSNSIPRVLERYWRWYRAQGRMGARDYCRQLKFAVTVMAREDLAAGDPGAALISLLSPHYQFWRDRWE